MRTLNTPLENTSPTTITNAVMYLIVFQKNFILITLLAVVVMHAQVSDQLDIGAEIKHVLEKAGVGLGHMVGVIDDKPLL